MTEDGIDILSGKTWSRTVEPVNKLGYMDGAVDGQAAVFQSSFDSGYMQGLNFGLQLGLCKSTSILGGGNDLHTTIRDQRRINCQICLNYTTTQETVTNLYNLQQEQNKMLLKNTKE